MSQAEGLRRAPSSQDSSDCYPRNEPVGSSITGDAPFNFPYSGRMKLLSTLVLVICLPTAARAADVVVVRAGVLIDGRSSTPRRDQVIVIRGARIESVSAAASAHIPDGAKVIDLSRATVMPGFAD